MHAGYEMEHRGAVFNLIRMNLEIFVSSERSSLCCYAPLEIQANVLLFHSANTKVSLMITATVSYCI